jgi:hypothetical protein
MSDYVHLETQIRGLRYVRSSPGTEVLKMFMEEIL